MLNLIVFHRDTEVYHKADGIWIPYRKLGTLLKVGVDIGNFELRILNLQIGNMARFRSLRIPICNSDSPTFIAAIGWAKDPKDNFSMIVELNGMCDPCWEYMKFDPITGIFGESIGHGSF